MGRAPCCDKANVKKGPWSPEEDAKLKDFIEKFGTGGNWIALPQKAGLKRCGKSCRLRWLNYLRPNIKHGEFSDEEDRIICTLFVTIGSRWSIIASQLPGRTDNDIKNYWNTKLKKKLMAMIPPPPPPSTQPLKFHQPQFSSMNQPLSLFYMNSQQNLLFNKSLTSPMDSLSAPQNFLNSLPLSSHYSSWDSNLLDSQYYPLKDNITPSNMLMFGGNEGSCSSSDGSCNHISYRKDHLHHHVKQEDHHMGSQFQGFNNNNNNNGISNVFEDNSQKFMLHYNNNNGKMINGGGHDPLSGVFLDDLKPNVGIENNNSQLEYDLEEVKQLISSNNQGSCENITVSSSFLLNEDSKTQDREMYYYYS